MNPRPLTVAMVAAMPYPMAKASVIRVTHMVRALVERYPDVRVKLFAYRGAGEVPSHPRIELHLVDGFRADKASYYSLPNKLAADMRLIGSLARHRDEFDLIHCHTIEGLFIALGFRARARRRVPICMDVHGPVVAEMVHYGLVPNWRPVVGAVAALERRMLRSVDQAFVSNEGLRGALGDRIGPDRVKVVYDYVSPEQFGPDRVDRARVAALDSKWRPGGERLIAYLGMFKDYQGVDFLLRAFAQVAPRHPQARLLLVGDGPCRAQYESLIRELHLEDRVLMPGLVPHSDVPNWLAVSDIVVSPRVDNHITRAGFVSQMPEYMAAGRVIVSTWVSGCRHLLRDGAGILVEPNDAGALAAGLERALHLSPQEREALAAQARRNVEQFTWQKGIADVHDAYQKIIGREGFA